MYLLSIELERRTHGEVQRERRQMIFRDRDEAEATSEYFSSLAKAGFTQFLRNGETISVRECTLEVAAPALTSDMMCTLQQSRRSHPSRA